MWQRGGRTSRDGDDGEVIILIDEWVEGPRTSLLLIRKGSQNSQPQDEATLIDEQNKGKKLSLPERRGNLPNFWYTFSNESNCLRFRFLDHFDEPQDFRIYI